jgi:uncharacterized membrane protein
VNHKIIEDLGENYQYVKTIIDNKIEIIKLNLLNQVYKKTGNIILFLVTVLSSIILGIGLLIAFSFWLSTLFQSYSLGFLAGFSILIPINLFIFIFRKALIYRPIANFYINLFINQNEEKEEENG